MKRILIVDDDDLSLKVLTRHLTQQGYQVYTATSGAEGLERFSQDNPDLVVSDVVMPDMDGFEFCRQLRLRRVGELVPFIFLSSRGELDDRVQGYELGADDYLTKPFEPRELTAKIESQIERTRRMQMEMMRLIQVQKQVDPLPQPPPAADQPKPEVLPLTPAEERVFREVIRGATNKQVGETLFISPRTVQTHLTNILGKLALENRAQLVRYAYEHGHISDPPSGHQT
ncbi:MAG: response regulator transcription factor [Synechococcaceae cyanobacterium RM1_1_27]|nr:response regulator transcription factor [Synechococcaceae cyanobacterium SM2_3_2]NJO85808.1 response regulator transcription factor [Synechococcaceae cyanobacterium RM1_1_27]